MRRLCFRGPIRGIIACAFIWVWFGTLLYGQVNSWTNPASGNWEDPNWSLGVLPGSGQAILFTNGGWKALAIGPNTVENHPQTLNVQSITVSAPSNSYNVLLLNYAGNTTPVQAATVTINSNAALTTLASTLLVTNTGSSEYRLEIGGTVNHGEFSTVSASFLSLGSVGPGVYNLTNGILNVGTGYVGGTYTGRIVQQDGFDYVGLLRVLGLGEYDLLGGVLNGPVELYFGGILKQSGGVCNGGLRLDGSFLLQGGTFAATALMVPPISTDTGLVMQTGGTNQCGALQVGWAVGGFQNFGFGSYVLTNGTLFTSGTTINTSGSFSQSGGTHAVQGPCSLFGNVVGPDQAGYAYYLLEGGSLSSSSIELSLANFNQSGGTNQVSGDLALDTVMTGVLSPYTDYYLYGGLLMASNQFINYSAPGGAFTQSGGTNDVANLLSVSGPGYNFYGYGLYGGQLSAPNILLTNGGVFYQGGGAIVNNGRLTLANGTWLAGQGTQQLGQLQLGVGSTTGNTNSTLSLPAGPCVLLFADSSSLTWSNGASLTIENWHGSLQGGGQSQVAFGASSGGLTAQQLGQIYFHDPAGFPSGTYPARLLPTGEITPGRVLETSRSGSDFVLIWDGASHLQTSTNVTGPYSDLTGAASPYTNRFSGSRRFFRLRQ
jgi:hypothetical protein